MHITAHGAVTSFKCMFIKREHLVCRVNWRESTHFAQYFLSSREVLKLESQVLAQIYTRMT